MLVIYQALYYVYWIIYLWVVVFCAWNVFTQKKLGRSIGAAMVMVPFIMRMFNLH